MLEIACTVEGVPEDARNLSTVAAILDRFMSQWWRVAQRGQVRLIEEYA